MSSSYIGRSVDAINNISTLDNLSFNGSDTVFNLTQNSVAFNIVSVDALQIQIDGIIQVGNFTQTGGSQITFDFTPNSGSVCNSVKHFGVGIITQPSDGSVNMAQLGASGTKSSSTFLAGDNSFKTVSGTTINNNADNRVITGSGTANTLEGEARLRYDGDVLWQEASGSTTEFRQTVDGAGTYWSSLIASASDVKLYTRTASPLLLGCNNAEKMRIDNNGVLAIGTTSVTGNTSRLELKGTESPLSITNETATNSSDRVSISLRNSSGTMVGNVAVDNSNAMFNTSSDYRLKENEVAISDGITRLKQLKPYKFNFKIQADKTVDGFFAHEVSSIVPEAITGEKDAVEDNGDIKPQSIDQSKLVPLLTSALQEAITKIETLEARVQTLENA